MAIRGTAEVRRSQVARAVLSWAALAVRLAFKKGQYGAYVDWIGTQFAIRPLAVEAMILEARLKELKQLIIAMRGKNFVSLKALRTFTGKAQSMASRLFTWRPFVHMLYALSLIHI